MGYIVETNMPSYTKINKYIEVIEYKSTVHMLLLHDYANLLYYVLSAAHIENRDIMYIINLIQVMHISQSNNEIKFLSRINAFNAIRCAQ